MIINNNKVRFKIKIKQTNINSVKKKNTLKCRLLKIVLSVIPWLLLNAQTIYDFWKIINNSK